MNKKHSATGAFLSSSSNDGRNKKFKAYAGLVHSFGWAPCRL